MLFLTAEESSLLSSKEGETILVYTGAIQFSQTDFL